MELTWDHERMSLIQQIVIERFAQNCVAGHLFPVATVDESETTIRKNPFNYLSQTVDDTNNISLYETDARVYITKAQMDEVAAAQGSEIRQARAITTITRATSNLARKIDDLCFSDGTNTASLTTVRMTTPANRSQSLRGAAIDAETEFSGTTDSSGALIRGPETPYPVPGFDPNPKKYELNEELVTAAYGAVAQLEGRGYYSAYNFILGEMLWQALHRPTPGSMVLPRDRIEPTLMGGSFYRTTTLPKDEALLASLDGPTFDYVLAGDPARHPKFEFLRVEAATSEELYLFRVRVRFAPRVRENRAIIRLKVA